MLAIECFKAVLYGIVEGITEWLPISSTGHLILFGERFPFAFTEDVFLLEEFREMFDVVIQLGAILAVLVLFWRRLFPFARGASVGERREILGLWGRLALASVPAAAVGILGDRLLLHFTGRDIDGWFFTPTVVALMLILYGIAFLFLERRRNTSVFPIASAEKIDTRTALGIGMFQALSIIPGTSRSGATILGAGILGVSRSTAAEFSFFMAIPVMLGASGIKLLGFFGRLAERGAAMPPIAYLLLAIGSLTAFAVSLITIRFLTDFVKRHSFLPFAIYRILLGLLLLMLAFA